MGMTMYPPKSQDISAFRKSYLLKMPPLRSAHGAEHFDVGKVKVAK